MALKEILSKYYADMKYAVDLGIVYKFGYSEWLKMPLITIWLK